ncbi:MAG: DUF4249 domain-containing protein [bacterium]|nr:DUF4249 domain-containing protein [bacterium]
MRYILFFAIGLLTVISFSSCGEDAFTQIVDIELPEHEPRLAVHALAFSESDAFGILVSNSRSVLSNEDFSVFPDAEIRFSGPNVDGATFSYTPDDGRHYTVLSPEWAAGEEMYTLDIQQADYPAIRAQQRMPAAPTILDVRVEEEGALSEDGFRQDEIIIEIQDEPGEHYYALQAEVGYQYVDENNDTIAGYYSVWLESNDPILSYAEVDRRGALICSDGAFNGNTYRFATYTWEDLPIGLMPRSQLRIRVTSLSRDAFLYYRSLRQYWEAEGNPFAEPVTVHSNIENGYGIFGLGHTRVFSVDL